MPTTTEIANLALQSLGVDQAIADLDAENTKLAKVCRTWFDQCRDEVLGSFPWAFATKSVALAESSDEGLPGWAYIYTYPTDCLLALEVTTSAGSRVSSLAWRDADFYAGAPLNMPRYPWRTGLSDNNESRVVLCDLPNAYLIYVARVTSPAVYPRSFVSALAARLAAAVANPLRVDGDIASRAESAWLAWESRARAASLSESLPDRMPESASISVRE